MLKKLFLSLFAFSLLFLPSTLQAVNLDSNGLLKNAQKTSGYADADETTLAETVGKIINVALSLVGTICTVLIVYAGFLWMTAQGETDQITKAKGILQSAIIGLAIVLAAYSISTFVVNSLIDSTLS